MVTVSVSEVLNSKLKFSWDSTLHQATSGFSFYFLSIFIKQLSKTCLWFLLSHLN